MSAPPPFSAEVERGILGCLILEPSTIAETATIIEREDFYAAAHGTIYDAITTLHRRGELVEARTVSQHLRQTGQLHEVGGELEIYRLGDNVPSSAALRHYRDEMVRLASARSVMSLADEVRETAAPGTSDALAEAQALLARGPEALQRLQETSIEHVSSPAERVKARMLSEAVGEVQAYMPTGVLEWDANPDFSGISTEGMTLILAASGMGKTTLLNALAVSMASQGWRVHLHGTETSRDRRTSDLALGLAGISKRSWASMPEGQRLDDYRRLEHALGYLSSLPLTVSGAGLTVEQVAAIARNLRRRGRLDVLIVDYLQDFRRSRVPGLPQLKGPQTDHASVTLKETAAELQIPVIVGAQVSGEKNGVAPNGPKPVPQTWDVQWSSQAHQDAEEIMALYRDDYYADRYREAWTPKGRPGYIEVIARKRRDGRMAELELPFHLPGKWAGTRPGGW